MEYGTLVDVIQNDGTKRRATIASDNRTGLLVVVRYLDDDSTAFVPRRKCVVVA